VNYHSYFGGGGADAVAVERGVVQVASAGNDVGISVPSVVFPAATQFLHPTDEDEDAKVIAVASISDGNILTAADCSAWNPSNPPPAWNGDERFTDGWTTHQVLISLIKALILLLGALLSKVPSLISWLQEPTSGLCTIIRGNTASFMGRHWPALS
jgi:hypothetical protein